MFRNRPMFIRHFTDPADGGTGGADPAPEATDPATEPAVETFDAEYVRKLRAESAKYRTEAKANADAAKRLAEIEEAQKTEAEKMAERLADAERKAAEAELKVTRAQVAQTKGVPAELITGSTEDEMNASADALLAFKGEQSKPPAAPPADGQGKVGEPVGAGAPQLSQADVEKLYAEKQYEAIEKARLEGRLNTVLGIA